VTLFRSDSGNRLCWRPLGQAAQDQSSELNELDTEELGPGAIKRADNVEAKHSTVFSSRTKRFTSASSNVASAKLRGKKRGSEPIAMSGTFTENAPDTSKS